MTPFLYLYFALLIVWLPLLFAAFRLRGKARLWVVLVVGLGFAAALYEVWMFVWVSSAIRLDIPLISFALICLYASVALVLLVARQRWMAGALLLVLVIAGAGMATEWISIGRESDRLSAKFEAGNQLLFEAKFRDLDTYQRSFGAFDARPTAHPVGHWIAQDDWRFTRLIINAKGQVWLFYRCGVTECAYGPTGSGLHPAADDAASSWQATINPRAGQPLELKITRSGANDLLLSVRDQELAFIKAPPPIDPMPARAALIYLGPFALAECRGQYAEVRQLWLWQEEKSLYAVGVFATLPAGRRAGFVLPVLLGSAVEANGAWRFQWDREGTPWRATVSLEGLTADLMLERAGEVLGAYRLHREALFHDEVIDLAALTSKADWEAWFDTVLAGHFTSGEVPACP